MTPDKNLPSLSIIIPVFNEAARLPKTFSGISGFIKESFFDDIEIIFVDDGSTDDTAKLINKASLPCHVRLISYKTNKGKGHAVRVGMLNGSKDYRLFLDADMSTPLEEIEKFMPVIIQEIPVIIGSRKIDGARVEKFQPWHRRKMGMVYSLLAQIVTGVNVNDFTCGFKCFSREATRVVFSKAKIDRWSYDAEILFLAKKHNFQIREIGVSWTNDEQTRVRLGRDIIKSFFDLIKIRLFS